MKGIIYTLIFIGGLWFNVQAQNPLPSDPKATKETANLYRKLKKVAASGRYLFGHQDALAYGVKWKYEEGRSDVRDITGEYPAVYGWELGHLEIGDSVNLDSVPFDKMKRYIRQGYDRGGIITISWHGRNPMTGKTAWDPENGTVASLLPGGASHDVFRRQLDKVADFLLSLKGSKGEYIPVLFRPYHELTGGWFWWGTKTTSADEYKSLFRFTVDYLQKKRGIHHLLYVYNTGTEYTNEREFLARYPGDDVIDLLSFDTYQSGAPAKDENFAKSLSEHLSIIEELARKKDKIAAVGETGFNRIPYSKWWTESLAAGLKGHKFAYVLLWRNAGYKPSDKAEEFYAPHKGHDSENDFLEFYKMPETMFEKDAAVFRFYK